MSKATNHPHHLVRELLRKHDGGPYRAIRRGVNPSGWDVVHRTDGPLGRPVVQWMGKTDAQRLAGTLNAEWARWELGK